MDTKEFKGVIEDIVDTRINNKGITKYISAIVSAINSDGSVNVYLPPDTTKIVSNVANKTGEYLNIGDSVELCTKNGKTNNAWIAVKHRTNLDGNNAYQVRWAKLLPDGTDLNTIVQPGTYRSRGTTQTSTMKNVPASQTSGFELVVFNRAGANYFDGSTPECMTQEIKRDSRIFTRYTWDYGETWSDWAVHCGYRIGDIFITSTPDNPSSQLGGKWELFDKEFESYQNKYTDAADIAKYITCTSNCNVTEFVVRRIGHTIIFRIYFQTLVELNDSTISLADLNFSALGIKGLSYQQTNILMGGDGGNGIAITNVSDGGNINVVDVIPKGTATVLAAGYTPRLYYQQALPAGNMLNEVCDKFYWRRTE